MTIVNKFNCNSLLGETQNKISVDTPTCLLLASFQGGNIVTLRGLYDCFLAIGQ